MTTAKITSWIAIPQERKNSASPARMRPARAPLRQGAQSLIADNALNQLKPIYQITPIITIDAHVGTVP